MEQGRPQPVTFLTVTNKGAATINRERIGLAFEDVDRKLQEYGVPSDPMHGGGLVYFEKNMRIRLTRNLDKDRGFVNGALGVIEHVLADDVFVLRTSQGVRILVHPVTVDGRTFMPVTYAYAITMRRAQGSTLGLVVLWFDHAYPADRGYAYVGASRVRFARDLYHMGPIRRTDWLPVGQDPDGGEQTHRGPDSEDDDSSLDERRGEDEEESCEDEDESEDRDGDS